MKKKIFSILAAICCSVGLMAQDTPDYLSFTAKTAPVTLSMAQEGTTEDPTLESSFDKSEWTTFTIGTQVEIPANSTLYLRRKTEDVIICFPGNTGMNYSYFTMSGEGTIEVGGNVMSLLDKSCNSRMVSQVYGLRNLFLNCTKIVSVSEDLLPATALANKGAYQSMFEGCTNLKNAPKLPSNLRAVASGGMVVPATFAYSKMFQGCTSLTDLPDNMLPATDLTGANSCYANMFNGCESLVNAPELPATILSQNCYSGMFQGCINLEEAPFLPAVAANLGKTCYKNMFNGCTKLKYLKVAFETWDVTKTADWLKDAYSGTDAVFEGPQSLIDEFTAATPVARAANSLPNNWIPTPALVLNDNVDNASVLSKNVDKGQEVQLRRTFQAGMWNTICLPFALDADQIAAVFGDGTQVGTMTRAEMVNEELILGFNTNVTTMDAGYPYIILLGNDENVVNPTFEGVTITTTEAGVNTSDDFAYNFKGTFSPVTSPAYTPNVDLYLGTGNTVHPISGGTLNGFRAYFAFNNPEEGGEGDDDDNPAPEAPKRIRLVINGAEETTAMDEMEVLNPAEKMIENGQVVIIKNGVKYNVFGQQL